MAVGDEQVVVSVQVDIEEHRLPRPVARLDPGVAADLGEGAVAAIPKQRVARHQQAVGQAARHGGARIVWAGLRQARGGVAAEHLHHEKVGVAVAVDVGEVRPHRGVRHRAHRLRAGLAEFAGAVVEPEPVRRLEIVADVNVSEAVGVDVTHLHTQPEVERLGKRLAVGLNKPTGTPRHFLKYALPVVEVKGVRLTVLDQLAVDDFQPAGVLSVHDHFATHLAHRIRPAVAQQRQFAEVGHV